MQNNVNLISETYEDIATGKLQICWCQPPYFDLSTVLHSPSNIYILPETRVIDLHICR